MDRMYNQKGAGQTAAQYWGYFFGSFSDKPEGSLYKSCEAKDASTAVINITRSTSSFPTILSLDSFSMQSPTALKAGDANNVVAAGRGLQVPRLRHRPGRRRPVQARQVRRGQQDRHPRGERHSTSASSRRPPRSSSRSSPTRAPAARSCKAGSIDGYDLPNPVDWKGLKDDGNNVAVRPAFNILYMGLNGGKNPKLKDLKVRQAICHALNRDQMVKTQLPEGAKVATQFMPDTVSGYNTDLQPCAYDPEKAKALLKEAGAEGMTLQFAFPTEVSRPYMPDPQKIHAAFTKDLEAVGIKVDTVSKPWNGGYLDDTNANKYDAWLLGWTGDYNAADNFIGTFFANIDQNDFNTKAYPWGKTLSEDLKKADAIVDVAEREAAYKKINQQIAEEYIPGIPISHSPPALVVSGNVEGLVPSPLTAETFDTVTVKK